MANDFDLPNGLLDRKLSDGPNPDERDPSPRTSRHYHHLRSLAENGDLEDAFENVDTLAFMRLCMLRLAEKGDWKEAARIAKELAPYLHQRLPNVNVVRHETAVAAPPAPAPLTPVDPGPAAPPTPETPVPDPSTPQGAGPDGDAPPPRRPHGDDPPRTLIDARRQARAHDRQEQRDWMREARWNYAMACYREQHRRAIRRHALADPAIFTPPPANDSRRAPAASRRGHRHAAV